MPPPHAVMAASSTAHLRPTTATQPLRISVTFPQLTGSSSTFRNSKTWHNEGKRHLFGRPRGHTRGNGSAPARAVALAEALRILPGHALIPLDEPLAGEA